MARSLAAALFALLSLAACATTAPRASCPQDEFFSSSLGGCLPLALLESDVPDVPLVRPAARPPLFEREWRLVVRPRPEGVVSHPLLGMVEDDVLDEGAFYAGRKAPSAVVVETTPAGK